MISRLRSFFKRMYRSLKGPAYQVGHEVPYYGGAVRIQSFKFCRKYGWLYKFSDIDGDWEFAEDIVKFYLENPGRDGRSYDRRNNG